MFFLNCADQVTACRVAWENFEDGVAGLLCVKSLRHGTNVKNNFEIRVNGADPSHGGKVTGSTHNWMIDNTKDYFYVFKDFDKLLYSQQNKSLAIRHAYLSSYNQLSSLFEEQFNCGVNNWIMRDENPLGYRLVNLARVFFSALYGYTGCILPSISFHFSRIDYTRFEEDKKYRGLAYKTKMAIEPWRIGIRGAILTGCNLNWFYRVRLNPSKVLVGILKISFSALIVKVLKENVVGKIFDLMVVG